MKKIIKDKKAVIFFTIFLLIVIILFTSFVKSTVSKIGGTIGENIGNIVGAAKGIKEGTEEGKQQALEDPKTEINIATEIQKIGYLQVLEMDIQIADVYYIGGSEDEYNDGDYSNVKYAEYYTEDGEVIFKIDLSSAEIVEKQEQQIIEVNIKKDVEISIIPNTNTLKRVDKFQEHNFTGSTAKGERAFRNSYNKVVNKTKEELSKNEQIMNEARQSAKAQINNLIKAIKGSKTIVKFSIAGIEVQD